MPLIIDGSRADSGRPLFVIFFFKIFFFRVGPSRAESKKLGPTQKKVGPSRAESNFFWFFFFWGFFFLFCFFLVFIFLEKILLWGGRRDPSRAEFFFRLGPTFF